MEQEIITLDWCANNGFKKQLINVATDTTYFYEGKDFIICFTRSTCGRNRVIVSKYSSRETIEFECQNHGSITLEKLRDLCGIVNVDYPF